MRGWQGLFVAVAACTDHSAGDLYPTPIAIADQVSIDEDARTLALSLLVTNDITSSCRAHAEVVTSPQHGLVTTDSSPTYVPDPGFHGPDAFTYRVVDCGGISDPATVTVDVRSNGIPYEQAIALDPTPVTAMATGDINGDGKADVVILEEASSTVVILVNRTTTPGAYAVEPVRFEGGHAPVGLAVADLDGDGRLDLVTAAGTDGLVILRNLTPAGGTLAFAAPLLIPAGSAVGVVAADLDGDGRPDLASIDEAGNRLDVRLNISMPGTIAFGARTSFVTPPGPRSLEAVDADGTGGMDLAVLAVSPWPNQDSGAGTFALFANATALGDAVPSFAARVDRATGQYPTALFVADLDGDHRPEIGVVDDGLWIYANQSAPGAAPSYLAARVLDLAGKVLVAAPIDLDGNGSLDLVLGTTGQDPVTTLVNQSAPASGFAFAAHQSVIGDGKHARVSTGQPSTLRLVELDGVPPAEVVLGTSHGSLLLHGD